MKILDIVDSEYSDFLSTIESKAVIITGAGCGLLVNSSALSIGCFYFHQFVKKKVESLKL